jgi:hypothetical protein
MVVARSAPWRCDPGGTAEGTNADASVAHEAVRLTVHRRGVSARRLGPLLAAWLAVAIVSPGTAAAATVWSKSLWMSGSFLYQDPYYTACTAATTMFMLNTIARRGTGGTGFIWRPSTVKNDPANPRDLVSILAWERAHDTLNSGSDGSDAHGWRNALNYFGWGSAALSDPARMIYNDVEYTSFSSAVHGAVRAMARFDKPVGVLAWAGGHAQVLTAYTVTGENPVTSDNFTVNYVWLSDPLKSDGYVNLRLGMAAFQSGDIHYRFRKYLETDSAADDPYFAGFLRSSVPPTTSPSEWYGKWVLVQPIRTQLPPPAPTPVPSPSRAPVSTPTPAPSA